MPPGEETAPLAVWLQCARSDLAFAHLPLPSSGLREQLCFHAQQAAEKAIKAVLIHEGVEFPYIHSIRALTELLHLAQDHH